MDEGYEGDEGEEEWPPVSATPQPDEPSLDRLETSFPPSDGSNEAVGGGIEPSTGGSHRPRVYPVPVGVALVLLVAIALVIGLASSTKNKTTAHSSATTQPGVSTRTTTSVIPTHTAAQIVQLLDPAVVDVNTIEQDPTGYADTSGTGMIISPNGYIVTNNHVVASATSITVSIDNYPGTVKAQFVGADPTDDLAVIKVDGFSDLPTVHFGNSATLQVGAPVVAIGNAFGRGGSPAVTLGKVLALDRSISASENPGLDLPTERLFGMIQTDALIEPGNSGGPLVNSQGQVVGMNTAATTGQGNAFGFAEPIAVVRALASEITEGKQASGILFGVKAFLGIYAQDVTSVGVEVTRIIYGFPAASAGIEPNDVIVSLNGQPITSVAQLKELVLARKPGSMVVVGFRSGGGTSTVTLQLVPGPAP